MKKTFLIAVLLLTSAIVNNAKAIVGDVNGDGYVTAADITALYNYLLLDDTSHLVAGDVNNDGYITSGDVTQVYNILLGDSTPDPAIPDYQVNIVYDGTTATVVVAKNIESLMTVEVNGAHVNIVASPTLQDSVIYNLSGTTTCGSFYMDG
ncbi:MAG: dockerin type I repeat-containing protein, partial [Muribaculaceae bacterium]|nr:dockerin type I repeat-containing protein [Muribaculaceae bacterium]